MGSVKTVYRSPYTSPVLISVYESIQGPYRTGTGLSSGPSTNSYSTSQYRLEYNSYKLVSSEYSS